MDTLIFIVPVVIASVALGMVIALHRQMKRFISFREKQEREFENEVETIVNGMTVKEFLTRIGRDAGY